MKLNLGSGSSPLNGYDNIDRRNGREVFPLPQFLDNSVDEIRASHVLEHFAHQDVPTVMQEWVRVLKPGGTIKVAVPDFRWITEKYQEGKNYPFESYLMGGHADENDYHGCVFDRESLFDLLTKAGIVDIQEWRSEVRDCASLPVSLNLTGIKAGPLPKIRIVAAMSVPRLGFQVNFFCWAHALMPLGIQPYKYEGAFWGQCLERTMTEHVENENCDWILTIDYDSVFTRENVETLIRLTETCPEADAIAAMQPRRHTGTPLMTIRDENGGLADRVEIHELYKPAIPVNTAHFGLTLIKCEALRRMEHPWFMGVPNKHGRWDEDRVDDDAYFWHKWREIGNTVYVANRCPIGHAEMTISWLDKNLEQVRQSPEDYQKQGPPESAWR